MMNRLALPLAAVLLLATHARAETALEREIFSHPMPHEGTPGGDVLVHWVRLQGSAQPPTVNAEGLTQLKQDVSKCAAGRRAAGQSVQEVKEWPDLMHSMRLDSYNTGNYSITYATGAIYGYVTPDCGLFEPPFEKATLSSSAGTCEIDLKKKTAHGQCDLQAHMRARAPRHLTSGQIETQRRNLPAQIAAYLPEDTGARKTIAGLKCEVHRLNGEDICVARGGSFRGGVETVLERVSEKGAQMKAVDAKLDAKVDVKLFEPHLIGGFKIDQRGRSQ